jgi:DNA-directed RNA polymerase subunit K/omega
MTDHDDTPRGFSYLDLVEEYPRNPKITQFEKVLVAAHRAKDLHDHDKVELAHNHFTAAYTALEEMKEGIILSVYREEEPAALLEDDSDDGEEE